jgi:hypothetical protein
VSRGISPALSHECLPSVPGFGLQYSIPAPQPCVVDVSVGRYHIEVTGQHHRFLQSDEPLCMGSQPRHPRQLVFELGTGPRISIGQVQGGNTHALDFCFEIARLPICVVAGQASANLQGVRFTEYPCSVLQLMCCAQWVGCFGSKADHSGTFLLLTHWEVPATTLAPWIFRHDACCRRLFAYGKKF